MDEKFEIHDIVKIINPKRSDRFQEGIIFLIDEYNRNPPYYVRFGNGLIARFNAEEMELVKRGEGGMG